MDLKSLMQLWVIQSHPQVSYEPPARHQRATFMRSTSYPHASHKPHPCDPHPQSKRTGFVDYPANSRPVRGQLGTYAEGYEFPGVALVYQRGGRAQAHCAHYRRVHLPQTEGGGDSARAGNVAQR
jgi:hypothetical protein